MQKGAGNNALGGLRPDASPILSAESVGQAARPPSSALAGVCPRQLDSATARQRDPNQARAHKGRAASEDRDIQPDASPGLGLG